MTKPFLCTENTRIFGWEVMEKIDTEAEVKGVDGVYRGGSIWYKIGYVSKEIL